MTIRNSRQSTHTIGSNKPGCLLGFGLLWTAFSGVFLVLMLTDDPQFLGIFFISIFVVIGLALTGYSLMAYYARFKVGRPDFTISHKELAVGDTFDFSFHHTFKRAVTINWIKTQLILRETATYQRGTDTTTVTHDHIMEEYEEPGTDFRSGHMLQKAYSMQIPPDSMHTLKVRRNSLQWFLKFEADIPSLPNFVEEFELTVLPHMKNYG